MDDRGCGGAGGGRQPGRGLAESNAFHRTKSRVDRTHARRTEVTPTSGSQRRQRRRARRTHAPCCCCCRCCCRPCHLRCAAALLPRPARVPTRLAALSTARPDNDSQTTNTACDTHTHSHPPTTPTTPPNIISSPPHSCPRNP